MQSYNQKRGIKRKINCSDFPKSSEEYRNQRHYWKSYLYNLDAHVYEALTYEKNIGAQSNINYWITHFKKVPNQFIILFHDLVHPKIIEQMLIKQMINIEQYRECTYISGYPSQFYFN